MFLILVPRHTGLVFFPLSEFCNNRYWMQVHYVLEDLEKFGQHDSKSLRLPSVLCSERVIKDGIERGGWFQERMKVLGCKRGSFLMISHKITYLVKWSSQGTLRCLEVPLGILGDIYWFIVQTSEGQFGQAIKRQLRQSKTSQRELRHLR